MNTEEIMKLADTYASMSARAAVNTTGEVMLHWSEQQDKARAALEAALSAKQEPDWTDSETGLLECWKNRLHPMSDRLLMADGAISCRDKIIANLRSQLASLSAKQGEQALQDVSDPAPSVNAQERISELEAQNAQLLGALIDIAYGLESARIWGGMDWTYNPLHPYKYLPLRDKARAAIAAVEGKV